MVILPWNYHFGFEKYLFKYFCLLFCGTSFKWAPLLVEVLWWPHVQCYLSYMAKFVLFVLCGRKSEFSLSWVYFALYCSTTDSYVHVSCTQSGWLMLFTWVMLIRLRYVMNLKLSHLFNADFTCFDIGKRQKFKPVSSLGTWWQILSTMTCTLFFQHLWSWRSITLFV